MTDTKDDRQFVARESLHGFRMRDVQSKFCDIFHKDLQTECLAVNQRAVIIEDHCFDRR